MECGGAATTDRVAKVLATGFPGLGLNVYVSRTLKRMERQRYIKHRTPDTWIIIRKNRQTWATNLYMDAKEA